MANTHANIDAHTDDHEEKRNIPAGLSYQADAIDAEIAAEILAGLDASPFWTTVTPTANARRVIHYGYRYDYARTSAPMPTTPIPPCLQQLAPMHDQLIINEYKPGQGIAPHIDHPQQFGDTITCYTLGAGVTMDFTHPDGREYSLWVAPNSKYVMTGEARYAWRHSIASEPQPSARVPNLLVRSRTLSTACASAVAVVSR